MSGSGDPTCLEARGLGGLVEDHGLEKCSHISLMHSLRTSLDETQKVRVVYEVSDKLRGKFIGNAF